MEKKTLLCATTSTIDHSPENTDFVSVKEESKREEKKGTHFCYCLESEDATRTYVGYTTDITRRIREHNQIIKGGARSTRGRAWKYLYILGGLPNRSEGLRLEYFLHHPRNVSVKSLKKNLYLSEQRSVIPKPRIRRACALAAALQTSQWTRKQEIPTEKISLQLQTNSDFLTLIKGSCANYTLPSNVAHIGTLDHTHNHERHTTRKTSF
jgi:predicted GIY-YIG superfamily endonuclease